MQSRVIDIGLPPNELWKRNLNREAGTFPAHSTPCCYPKRIWSGTAKAINPGNPGKVLEFWLLSLDPNGGQLLGIHDEPAVNGDGYGFRRGNGEMNISASFASAWYFSGGLARVRVDGLWGYINHESTKVIEPKFDRAWDFRTASQWWK